MQHKHICCAKVSQRLKTLQGSRTWSCLPSQQAQRLSEGVASASSRGRSSESYVLETDGCNKADKATMRDPIMLLDLQMINLAPHACLLSGSYFAAQQTASCLILLERRFEGPSTSCVRRHTYMCVSPRSILPPNLLALSFSCPAAYIRRILSFL